MTGMGLYFFYNSLCLTSSKMGVWPTLLKVGEGSAGDWEKWCPGSVTVFSVQADPQLVPDHMPTGDKNNLHLFTLDCDSGM